MLILYGQCALAEGPQANNRTGWFVGAGGGNGEVEVGGHDRSSQLLEALMKQGYQADSVIAGEDDNTDPWKLLAGYRFNPYWAVEIGYYGLGDTSGNFDADVISPSTETISGRVRSEYWAFSTSVVGYYPIKKNAFLLAKLSLHHWDHEQKFDSISSGLPLNQTLTDDGVDVLFGFGAGYHISQNFSLRVEWERFQGVEDEDGIDIRTLSVFYHF